MDEQDKLAEEVLRLAQETLFRGVVQGQLSHDNPQHQIIVAGAMLVLAAASAGISMDEAIARAGGITFDQVKAGSKDDGHPGQYL